MKSLKIESLIDMSNENVKEKSKKKNIGTLEIASEVKNELNKERRESIEVEKILFCNEKKNLHEQDKNNQNSQQRKNSINNKNAVDYEQNIDNSLFSTSLTKGAQKCYSAESKASKGQQRENNDRIESCLENLPKVEIFEKGSNMIGETQVNSVVNKKPQETQKEKKLKAVQIIEERKKMDTEKEEKELDSKMETNKTKKEIDNTEKDVVRKKSDDKKKNKLKNVEQINMLHPQKLELQGFDFHLDTVYRELYDDLEKENNILKQEIEKLKSVVEEQKKIINKKSSNEKSIFKNQEETASPKHSTKPNDYTKNLINFFSKKKKSLIFLNEKKRSFIKKKKKNYAKKNFYLKKIKKKKKKLCRQKFVCRRHE